MTESNEATTTDFMADDPSEESAVRMAPNLSEASEPPDVPLFESVPPPAASRHGAVPAEASGDSTLSRYFREMATHQVMGPDEELQAAQRVEETEVDHWTALLAHFPLSEAVLARLAPPPPPPLPLLLPPPPKRRTAS